MTEKKLTLHEMIYDVVQELTADDPERVMTYGEILQGVRDKFEGEKNDNSLRCHIVQETVNVPSRVHYGNPKPRIIDHVSRRDLLFNVTPGRVMKYDPDKHGIWEIRRDEETGKMVVGEVTTIVSSTVAAIDLVHQPSAAFALESHLRDYLARNLASLVIHGKNLELVRTEYPTGVGPVDILAKDAEGNFYVFELKCSRGTDAALGQILRYMGWIIENEADGKKVFGVIVAERMDEKLKFAIKAVSNIDLFEYKVNFQLEPLQ